MSYTLLNAVKSLTNCLHIVEDKLGSSTLRLLAFYQRISLYVPYVNAPFPDLQRTNLTIVLLSTFEP